jgi:hypothetical protein
VSVPVGIGDTQRVFAVHKDLITRRSKRFYSMIEGEISQEPTPVELRGCKPEMFDRYLHCLYHSEVPKSKVASAVFGRHNRGIVHQDD